MIATWIAVPARTRMPRWKHSYRNCFFRLIHCTIYIPRQACLNSPGAVHQMIVPVLNAARSGSVENLCAFEYGRNWFRPQFFYLDKRRHPGFLHFNTDFDINNSISHHNQPVHSKGVCSNPQNALWLDR